MYLDHLKETEQVIFRYNNIQKNNKDSSEMLSNLAGINGAITEINQQIALSQEAKASLVPQAGISKETAEKLYGQLSQICSDLEDRADVSDGNKAIKQTAKEFRDSENKKWRDAVSAKASSQSSLLQQLGGFTGDPASASTIVTRLKADMAQMPKSVQGIQEYGKVMQNAENIINNVGRTPAVMDFIQKVTSGQALFSDINEEVSHWIQEHHMGNRLRITL